MFIYGQKCLEDISKFMASHNSTIAVAESVTSGCLQTALSLADGATQFFQGGITVYNLGQKCRHLHIDPIHALSCNCVSEKVAAAMAVNVCKLFISDWAIGITGYAAPLPEENIKKLFACYAFVHKGELIKSDIIETDQDEPGKVQQFYTQYVLNDLVAVTKKYIK